MSDTLMQNALSLRRAGRLAEAADIYARILQNEPQHFEALHNLGIVRYQGGQVVEAERLMGEAIKLRPGAADAIYNRACVLQKLNRLEDAVHGFDAALALKPDYVEALTNRGTLLMAMRRHEAALADFDKAAALRPALPQMWSNRAGALVKLSRSAEALAAADRAIAMHPQYHEAWLNRGNALMGERRYAEALESFERAVSISANFANAWVGKGVALTELGRVPDAIANFNRALQLAPQDTETLFRLAAAHFNARQFLEAADHCRRLLGIDPQYPGARGMALFANLCCCQWQGLAEERARALKDLQAGVSALTPFTAIALTDSPEEIAAATRLWVAGQSWSAQPARRKSHSHSRIRITYLSANFHDHAVARLMAGVWEHHDKSKFEAIAVSFGPHDGSALRGRLTRVFDRFLDVRTESDAAATTLLRELDADIAVDLMGYTENSRPGLLSTRPAPVQVNFLGYPGTMGAEHIDYLIADRVVISESDQIHYREQVVYLPDSYLPNDSRRAIAPAKPRRAEAGLPEEAFVFASFNHSYKFTSAMFGVWMRVLEQVPGSVLWLGQTNEAAARNLKLEAAARRIDPDRIVLASYVRTQEDHLARLALADLVLDTLPYNSHATACDALWAGVPVLTCLGKGFAGRVAASALTALGLPELIAATPVDYETQALKIAREPDALPALKGKLARHRLTKPLFDTARFTRHLESAFVTMHDRSLQGEPPQSFAVAEGAP